MTMLTDVSAAYLTGTNTAYSGKTRVRGAFVTGTGTAIFRDGGGSGTTKLTINAAGTAPVVIPANGIKFETDVHVTISGLTAITVFYG
jgi:hypothetical protein